MKAGTFIVPPPPPPPPSTNVVPLTCDNVREELLPLLDKIKITRNHLRTCSPAKMDFFKKKLIILVKQRTTIMNKLPREFKGYKERCGNDFMLFENYITMRTVKTIDASYQKPLLSTKLVKQKCISITLKGTQCTRGATSSCGKFCKLHNIHKLRGKN